jgi:hypothetical protein
LFNATGPADHASRHDRNQASPNQSPIGWKDRPGASHLPDRNGFGEALLEEEPMVYVLFMVIAFAMLGVERLVAWHHAHGPERPKA